MIIYVAIIINSHTCLLQTDFEIKSRTQIFTIIQFCYQIKTIFPNSIVKTYINGSCIIFRHQIQSIQYLISQRSIRQTTPKLTPNAGPS